MPIPVNLNDREQQVSIVALKHYLSYLNAHFVQKKAEAAGQPPLGGYIPLNESDILAPGHSKAHVITALHKLTGEPIYVLPPKKD